MKVKAIIIVIILFAVNLVRSQSAYLIESDIVFPGYLSSNNAKTSIYTKGNDMKIETKNEISTQLQYYIGDTVTLIDKCKGYEDTYGRGTREEMNSIIPENKVTFKDIVIEKTTKTKKLLDYECKVAIIKYTVTSMGFDMKSECTVWYTDELELNESIKTGDINNVGVKNELVDAFKLLGGAVLKQETRVNSMLMTTITTTKVEKKENMDADFIIEKRAFEKPLTLQKFRNKITQRNTQRQQLMKSMPNHFPK